MLRSSLSYARLAGRGVRIPLYQLQEVHEGMTMGWSKKDKRASGVDREAMQRYEKQATEYTRNQEDFVMYEQAAMRGGPSAKSHARKAADAFRKLREMEPGLKKAYSDAGGKGDPIGGAYDANGLADRMGKVEHDPKIRKALRKPENFEPWW